MESEYDGLRIAKMFLGQVHPTLGRGRLIEVPALDDYLSLMIEDQIEKGLATSECSPGPNAEFVLPTKTMGRVARECLRRMRRCLPDTYASSTRRLEPCCHQGTPAFNIAGASLAWRRCTPTRFRYRCGG